MFRTGCFSMCIDFGLKIDLYKNNINRSTLRTGSVHAGVPSTRLYMLNLLGNTFCKKSISLINKTPAIKRHWGNFGSKSKNQWENHIEDTPCIKSDS